MQVLPLLEIPDGLKAGFDEQSKGVTLYLQAKGL